MSEKIHRIRTIDRVLSRVGDLVRGRRASSPPPAYAAPPAICCDETPAPIATLLSLDEAMSLAAPGDDLVIVLTSTRHGGSLASPDH